MCSFYYICTNTYAMNELLEQSDRLVNEVPMDFKRYLIDEINWDNRLIGIKGARGTGKTTMVLQWLHQKNLSSAKVAYFSIDDMYFTTNSLLNTGRDFYLQGGQILVLDEVHKYENWAREIKNLYDRYKDLKIIFTGSSIIDISKQEGDLSRRAMIYELHGLSYREYLKMNKIIDFDNIDLNTIIHNSNDLRTIFPVHFRPLEYFQDYLRYGYFPFSTEDKEGYAQRLRQLTRLIVETDMSEVKGFDIRNAKKMLQLIYIIAQQVPFKPNIIKLAEKSRIHRNSISNYLYFLEEARLISLLYPSGISIATLQKPEMVYLNNTNYMFAFASESPMTGSIRETFFYNQLWVKHKVRQPKTTDFEIDDQYIFEIGGKTKGRKQIKSMNEAYIVKDDLEYPAGKTLPLWLFGFLY